MFPEQPMTTADVLRQAKALITPETWGQGEEVTHGQRTCAFFALAEVVDEHVIEARRALASAIGVRAVLRIVHWNDAPGRTIEDVWAAYDRAIAIADGRDPA